MNVLRLLEVLRDAREEGRDGDVAAILDEIGVDSLYVRMSNRRRFRGGPASTYWVGRSGVGATDTATLAAIYKRRYEHLSAPAPRPRFAMLRRELAEGMRGLRYEMAAVDEAKETE